MKTPRYSDNRIQHIILLTLSSWKKSHFRPATARSTTTSATANATRSSRQTLPAAEGCGCKSDIAPRLHAMGVDVMLAGNMGDGAKNVLQRNGIAVIRGCHGPVEEVVAAYLAGRIADSGDACAHHHEGGCPEHRGTTGWHLAE